MVSHVVIDGWTKIGKRNQIFHRCSIGLEPQDMKFKGEETYLFIGIIILLERIRVIHRGTEDGGEETRHWKQ